MTEFNTIHAFILPSIGIAILLGMIGFGVFRLAIWLNAKPSRPDRHEYEGGER